jgi:hypothetical protein
MLMDMCIPVAFSACAICSMFSFSLGFLVSRVANERAVIFNSYYTKKDSSEDKVCSEQGETTPEQTTPEQTTDEEKWQ